MANPFLFLMGYRRLAAGAPWAGEIMNICREFGFVYRKFRFEGNYIRFECTHPTSKKLIAACRERGITVSVEQERGSPDLAFRYRYRYGFIVGFCIAAVIILWSGSVVWDVRIEGNETLTDKEVKETLRACGLYVGCKRKFKASALENRILIYSNDISWISVNIIGTVAEVEIREFRFPQEKEEDFAASNIVASCDGIIEIFEGVRGNVQVNIGDFVRKGDLLVSGIYDSKSYGYRYTRAGGRVLARVSEEISAQVPFEYDKKVYTGKEYTIKYLIFFEKEIKIFGNTGNRYAMYDTIDTEEYFNAPGARDLPVGIRTVRILEYQIEKEQRSERSALELAYYKLNLAVSSAARDGDLLSKSTALFLEEDGVTLKCRIEYVKDIALVREIQIGELLRPDKTG